MPGRSPEEKRGKDGSREEGALSMPPHSTLSTLHSANAGEVSESHPPPRWGGGKVPLGIPDFTVESVRAQGSGCSPPSIPPWCRAMHT